MRKILYVEDDPDTLEAVKVVLSRMGCQVFGAPNAKKALQFLAKKSPDLILLDIMLPDMSGWDLFQKIQKTGKAKHSKIAFLSAIPVSQERMKVLKKQGVADYIMKPFDKSDLRKRVRKILG